MLVGRGVQSCELKKHLFFEILFAAPTGTLARFAGPPGWQSRLNHHAVLDFYVEILGDGFSAAFAVLAAGKKKTHTHTHTHTHPLVRARIRRKSRRKNTAEKGCLSLRFSLLFFFFCFPLATPYFEHAPTPNRKKFARNPFCKKFPLNRWCHCHLAPGAAATGPRG